MRAKLAESGLDESVEVDSAGTINLHSGNLPDPRMRRAAAGRGIELTHRARQVQPGDLADFDLVLVMDEENLADVRSLDRAGKHHSKIRLFCEFCETRDETEVPDPYYGGADGFELVLDILEDGCNGIIRHLQGGTRGKA